jgi:hypothetical protein
MSTVLQATREQMHRLQEHLRRAWDDRDAAKAAHAADRDRLRRLVAAVRREIDDGEGGCTNGGTARAPGKAGAAGGLVWRDCVGLGRADLCSRCDLVRVLEACEGAGT